MQSIVYCFQLFDILLQYESAGWLFYDNHVLTFSRMQLVLAALSSTFESYLRKR